MPSLIIYFSSIKFLTAKLFKTLSELSNQHDVLFVLTYLYITQFYIWLVFKGTLQKHKTYTTKPEAHSVKTYISLHIITVSGTKYLAEPNTWQNSQILNTFGNIGRFMVVCILGSKVLHFMRVVSKKGTLLVPCCLYFTYGKSLNNPSCMDVWEIQRSSHIML